MIRNVKLFILEVVMASTLLMLTGCEQRLLMDEDKCAEIALEYLEEKYKTEFVVVSSNEEVFGGPVRDIVLVNKKNGGKEEYEVKIYPNENIDMDNDGYYDSYIVISDTYMTELVSPLAKKYVDAVLKDAGWEKFISYVALNEFTQGFSADFLLDKETFSMTDIFDKYDMDMYCWLEIPENVYSENLQEKINSEFKSLISTGDIISFGIEVYSEEVYKKREELGEKGSEEKWLGDVNHISFSIEKED